ncbi:ankyrin repeat-containing protein 2 [Striga asiatica]|uniref:Ankyrin repeat-containing protein 2 n=1 Tax=Striga asiatica TaxID=4170 RepID=A0A5A7PGW0_STRAF|nr:ankyrin repeat-containing protein 2 [Striga asiatica]
MRTEGTAQSTSPPAVYHGFDKQTLFPSISPPTLLTFPLTKSADSSPLKSPVSPLLTTRTLFLSPVIRIETSPLLGLLPAPLLLLSLLSRPSTGSELLRFDCGMFTIKCIEFLHAGKNVEGVDQSWISDWRVKLAAKIFGAHFDP